jgi:hypothetical protein
MHIELNINEKKFELFEIFQLGVYNDKKQLLDENDEFL